MPKDIFLKLFPIYFLFNRINSLCKLSFFSVVSPHPNFREFKILLKGATIRKAP